MQHSGSSSWTSTSSRRTRGAWRGARRGRGRGGTTARVCVATVAPKMPHVRGWPWYPQSWCTDPSKRRDPLAPFVHRSCTPGLPRSGGSRRPVRPRSRLVLVIARLLNARKQRYRPPVGRQCALSTTCDERIMARHLTRSAAVVSAANLAGRPQARVREPRPV